MIFRASAIITTLLFASHPADAEPCAPQDNAALAYWSVWAAMNPALFAEIHQAAREATIQTVQALPLWESVNARAPYIPDILEWIDLAAARPCCDFGLDEQRGPKGLDHHNDMLTTFSALSYLKGLRSASLGKPEGTLDSLVTLLRIAEHAASTADTRGANVRSIAILHAARLASNPHTHDLLQRTDLSTLGDLVRSIPLDDPSHVVTSLQREAERNASFLRSRFTQRFDIDDLHLVATFTGGGIDGETLEKFEDAIDNGSLEKAIRLYEDWMHQASVASANRDSDEILQLSQSRFELDRFGPVTAMFAPHIQSIVRIDEDVRTNALPALHALISESK